MKRIAILGCSHSDLNSNDHINWTTFLARKYPNILFDNYAASGHGHLYMDIALKHCLYENNYDSIIVQLTGSNRWSIPLQTDMTSHTWQKCNYWNGGPDSLDNLNRIILPTPRANLAGNGVHWDLFYDHRNISLWQNGLVIPKHKQSQYIPGELSSLAQYYTDLFVKMLNNTNRIKYFSVKNYLGDNMGLNDSIIGILKNKYGSDGVANRLDDTLHLNTQGYKDMADILLEHNIIDE